MRLIYLTIFLLLFCAENRALGNDGRCTRSTEGKEFWFGFMEGRNDNGNVHYIEITVTAREATSFQIFIGKSTIPLQSVPDFVGANGSVQIPIPLNLAEATGSETIQEKGIHLVAENPVNVYALNWDRNSADVAVIYPVPSLGKEYFTMCYTPNVDNRPAHGRNSEFLIVASEDNTLVHITPSVVTDGGKAAGISFSITLNKGEVYQVQSLNQRNLPGQGDLTGSYIKSDKPVAVYSGNFSTTVPAETGMSGYDHLFEQIPPLQTWGREYYAVPLRTRFSDRYRIMAAEDSTVVLVGNQPQRSINRGEYFEFLLDNSQPSRIIGDKPILVAQFSQSNNTDRSYTGSNGDPFMIILSSVSQSKNEVTFVAYNSNQIKDYYLNVVVLTSEKDNIELDGVPVGFHFKPFNGTDYSYAQLKIYSGTHTIKNLNPDRGFLAYVYGYGGEESYGFSVGFNLDLALNLRQGLNFEGDTVIFCKGQSIVLDAGPYFDNYLWSTGETTQKIIVSKHGNYWANGMTIDGCKRSDSIFILVSDPPKPDIGPDLQKCSPSRIKLDGGEIYAGYVWSTGEISRTVEVETSGQYHVTVFDKFGCAMRDTLNLTVFPVPTISMRDEKLTIGSKSRNLTIHFEGADSSMLANGRMEWKCDNQKLFFRNKTNISIDILVSDWGVYEVIYKFTTPDGCEVSGSVMLQFAEFPTSIIEFEEKDKNQLNEFDYNIFPNPNNGNFNIEFSGIIKTDISVEIFNDAGVRIKKYQFEKSTGFLRHNINFKGLTSGIYYVNVFSGEQRTSKEILVY